VPYYLLTVTVPAELRGVFLRYPVEMVPVFFAAIASALKALCARRKFLGGDIGFIAILQPTDPLSSPHPCARPGSGSRSKRLRAQISAQPRVSPLGEGTGARGAQGSKSGARQGSSRDLCANRARRLAEALGGPGSGCRTGAHGLALSRGLCEEVGLQRRQAARL
jgi:hypothetical protein